ncbi:transposase, MuDR, MULE transposase domain protein [Tanacetum coccineum]
MACSIPHSDDEFQALVQKQIDEDMVHQKAVLDLALQFDNACTTREGSDKDYELNLSMYRKEAKQADNGNLKQVVAIVKSCSLNALGDLNVTLKDLSGTVPGTIHYKVLDVSSYEKDITVGAAMILANVSVFTPKPSKHYLNITKRNVVEVFRKDTVSLALYIIGISIPF